MIYRISQGLRALFAWRRSEDLSPIEAILNPQMMALFVQMRRSEQHHSLRVLAAVRGAGHSQPELLIAALLHDVGKIRAPIGVMGRTLAVLTQAFAPARFRRWSQGKARGWHKPFVVTEQHPAWGAELLTDAEASPLTVALVRRHQEDFNRQPTNDEERLLAILQAADTLH